MLRLEEDRLPASCPFSLRRLNKSLYLIRENDAYEEYPNIYAKICTTQANESGYVTSRLSQGMTISLTEKAQFSEEVHSHRAQ